MRSVITRIWGSTGETSQQPTARATASNANRHVVPHYPLGLSQAPSGCLEPSKISNPVHTMFFLYIHTYEEV